MKSPLSTILRRILVPLCVGLALPVAAQVDDSALDLEPPLIEHTVVEEADASIRQQFVATVVDDDELRSVRFFYRFQGEPIYSDLTMRRISYSSTYIAEILTDPDSDRAIQYYLQAEDLAGNRTLRGYAFSPLTRRIVLPVSDTGTGATPAPAPLAVNRDDAPGDSAVSERRSLLYTVLGVLVVGAVIAASQGGSDSPAQNCPSGRCTIDITIDSPVTQ